MADRNAGRSTVEGVAARLPLALWGGVAPAEDGAYRSGGWLRAAENVLDARLGAFRSFHRQIVFRYAFIFPRLDVRANRHQWLGWCCAGAAFAQRREESESISSRRWGRSTTPRVFILVASASWSLRSLSSADYFSHVRWWRNRPYLKTRETGVLIFMFFVAPSRRYL